MIQNDSVEQHVDNAGGCLLNILSGIKNVTLLHYYHCKQCDVFNASQYINHHVQWHLGQAECQGFWASWWGNY